MADFRYAQCSNSAPVIDVIADVTVDMAATVDVTVSATDVDEDEVTISAVSGDEAIATVSVEGAVITVRRCCCRYSNHYCVSHRWRRCC